MKLKSFLTAFIVFYLMTACHRTDNAEAARDTAAKDVPADMASILSDDACFEKKMEQWFAKFNQLQNEGYSMQEANQGAIASVALEFKTCGAESAAFPK